MPNHLICGFLITAIGSFVILSRRYGPARRGSADVLRITRGPTPFGFGIRRWLICDGHGPVRWLLHAARQGRAPPAGGLRSGRRAVVAEGRGRPQWLQLVPPGGTWVVPRGAAARATGVPLCSSIRRRAGA